MHKPIYLTEHCKVRMQQRGVPEKVIHFLREHGKSINTHNDKKFFCNKKIINKLEYKKETRDFVRKFKKYLLSTAIVCNGNSCITVMKLYENKRMRWN